MLDDMKRLHVEIDDRLASELERQAPARSRQRSEFVRRAIRLALDAEVEAQLADAYRVKPDHEPVHFDPAVWARSAARSTRRSSRTAAGR